jgi:putative flippase GtrA
MQVFVRYFISGIVATMSHFVILFILVEFFIVTPLIASIAGFIVAIFVNYLIQYHWTFRCNGPYALIFIRYLVVTLLMMLLNAALFWLIYNNYTLSYLAVQVIVTSIVFICNFSINKGYTFVYSDKG